MKWLILDMLIPAGRKSFILAGNYIPGSSVRTTTPPGL